MLNVQKTLCFRTHSCGAAAMDTMSHDAGKYFVWDTQNTVWTSNEHNVGPLSLKYLHSELKWASRFSWVKVWNGSDLIKIWNIQICVHRINMLLWFDGWILDCIWTVMVPTSVIMSLKKKKKKQKTLFPLKTLQGSNDRPLQTWQIKCCWEPAVPLLSNTKP